MQERQFGEKELTEQKRVLGNGSDVHNGHDFVRMRERIAGFWRPE